jgi:molecular chaperone GrpE
MMPTETTELERLQEQLLTEHEMYLRALADFDNYRRRVERESQNTARSGKREIILSLLEVLDGFDRVFQHAEKNQSAPWEGVQAIHRKLLAVLQAQGIAAFESVGQKFDPALHEAIAAVEANGNPSGVIVEDLQHGYRWGDEVLRPARVRVAQ